MNMDWFKSKQRHEQKVTDRYIKRYNNIPQSKFIRDLCKDIKSKEK